MTARAAPADPTAPERGDSPSGPADPTAPGAAQLGGRQPAQTQGLKYVVGPAGQDGQVVREEQHAEGGGDGDALIDLVLQAYEYDRDMPLPALLVYGPFMLPEQQLAFTERAARLPNVRAIIFDARLEALMARAAGVVAMGGYNTFCEILSFDKPALIVPRTVPRM